MTTPTTPVHEVPAPAGPHPTTVEVSLDLASPQSRIAIRVPGGVLGRADAIWDPRDRAPDSSQTPQIWAAKHHWTEGPAQQPATVFEFDEPLPAGAVVLRIPFTPSR
jgi:hypothetical protein